MEFVPGRRLDPRLLFRIDRWLNGGVSRCSLLVLLSSGIKHHHADQKQDEYSKCDTDSNARLLAGR